MAEELWFVDPSAGGNKTKIPLAPRPIDLVGKVVGLIDNTKEQADVILETIAHELKTRYGVKEVIIEKKEAFSKPATAAQLDAMAKRVQVAAAAVGGWGSCTLCSVHDAVEFEKRGIPATVFLTSTFKNAALHSFRAKGMDGHPFIELPHPISNLTPDEMRKVTLGFVEQFVKQITD